MKHQRDRQNKIDEYGNKLIEEYKNNRLTCNDIKLLNLIFSNSPTQTELDNFLKEYDIETVGGYKALMLSYFMKMYPHLNFTQYETPRLKGVFNFYKFQNLKLISHFVRIGKIFNKNNIPILIIKGFAIKYLRPNLSRAMGDIDILVPENKYISAIEVCKKLGFRLDIYVHSTDIHEPSSDAGIMDIHRFIALNNKNERLLNKLLFKRARKTIYNGVEILVPSNEDLFFLSLVNLTKNLKGKTSNASTLYVLFDCKYLSNQPNFNWDIVIEDIKITKTQNEIVFAMKFINSIVPNLIPQNLYNYKVFRNSVHDSYVQMVYEKYFMTLQRFARKTKIKQVLKGKLSTIEYIKLKMFYKFCKYLRHKQNINIQEFILAHNNRKDLLCYTKI